MRNPAHSTVFLEFQRLEELGFLLQLLTLIPAPEFSLSSISYLWRGLALSTVHDPILGILPILFIPKQQTFVDVGFYRIRWAIAMKNSIENNLKLDSLCLKFLWPSHCQNDHRPFLYCVLPPSLVLLPFTCSHHLYQISNSLSPPSWFNQGNFKIF